MKSLSMVFVAMFVVMFFLSCGKSNDTQTTDEDQSVANSDQDEDAFNDADVDFSSKPGDSFFSDPLNIQYTFKGYINDYSVVNTDDEQKGSMELTLKIGELDLSLNDIPTSYTYTYPDSAPENQRGKTFVAIVSAGGVAQDDGFQTYYVFINAFNVEKLKNLKENNIREFNSADAEAGVNINKYYVKSRADGSNVYRKCLKGVSPLDNKSKYFINNSSNKDFAVSETMLAWGNVEITDVLSDDVKEKLTEYNGEFCTFSLNGTDLTKDEYEAELVKDVTQFDCEMPEEFLTPISEKYGIIKIKGKINTSQNDSMGQSELKLQDNVITMDNLLQIQSANNSGNEIITLDSAGDIQTITGQTHYKYKYFQTIISKNLLKELKEEGKESLLIDDVISHESAISSVYEIEEKQITGKTLQKVCTIALATETPQSKIFFCFKNNVNFTDGEILQGAANTALNDDESYLLKAAGVETISELCYCASYTSSSYTPSVNCEEFENTEL